MPTLVAAEGELNYLETLMEDVFGIVGTTQAGAYQVEDVVAEGGFAVVYRAYHQAFRARVALKCLKVPDSLGPAQQAEFLERFREEGELLFRLSGATPAVVRPLHVGILEKTNRFVPFIALEWLDGESLDAVIERRVQAKQPPLGLKELLRLLTPAARAIELAHHFPGPQGEICILHRDLKPDNIFIAQVHGQQTAKILDFGIGKVKSVATQIVGNQSAQGDGLVAFTPTFGAPEQWLPKRFGQTGPWTDVWGFALTLLAALIGRAPFEGDQAALLGSAIDPGRRPTPRTEGVNVSDAVERVFQKAVAIDPRDRYTDVGVFWTDLHRALGVKEGSVSIAPPAPEGFAERLLVSIPADAHAATRPLASGSPPAAAAPSVNPDAKTMASPARAGALEVPDLDLGIAPARKARPSASDERTMAPQKITLRRDSGDEPPISASALGRALLDDESGHERPARSGPSRRAISLAVPLDGLGMSPRAIPARMPSARHGGFEPAPGAGTAALKEKLRGPIKLVLLGMLVMIGDFVYAQVTGELLAYGSIRPLYVAGPLVIAGLALAFVRFLREAR